MRNLRKLNVPKPKKEPYKVHKNTSLLLEFDAITVMNPNGTVSKYERQYPFLVQSGSFDVIREHP